MELQKQVIELQRQAEASALKAEFKALKPAMSKAVSKKKKQMSLSWKKIDGAEGYIIQ